MRKPKRGILKRHTTRHTQGKQDSPQTAADWPLHHLPQGMPMPGWLVGPLR